MEEVKREDKTSLIEIFEERAETGKVGEASECKDKLSAGNKVEMKKFKKYGRHNEGKWKQEEDEIYVKFILENRDKLASKTIRRSTRVFRQLAEILRFTRTPEQCRMHHQRMKKKARGRSITAIAKFIEKKYIRKRNAAKNKSLIENDEESDKEKEVKKEAEKTSCSAKEYKMKFFKIGGFSIAITLNCSMLNEW